MGDIETCCIPFSLFNALPSQSFDSPPQWQHIDWSFLPADNKIWTWHSRQFKKCVLKLRKTEHLLHTRVWYHFVKRLNCVENSVSLNFSGYPMTLKVILRKTVMLARMYSKPSVSEHPSELHRDVQPFRNPKTRAIQPTAFRARVVSILHVDIGKALVQHNAHTTRSRRLLLTRSLFVPYISNFLSPHQTLNNGEVYACELREGQRRDVFNTQ